MLNRRRVMGAKSLLPSGYTQLEELSVTSGRKYLDTGTVSKKNVEVRHVTKAKWYSSILSSNRQLNGYNYAPYWGANKGKFEVFQNISPTPSAGTLLVSNTWYDIDVTFNRTQGIGGRIFLFTLSHSNNAPLAEYKCYMSFKDYYDIYEDGVLVRHLVPCINPNNVEGMYDTVEGQFHALISW